MTENDIHESENQNNPPNTESISNTNEAEYQIIKGDKKRFKLFSNSKEILINLFTVVFGVLVAAFLGHKLEQREQQNEVKDFLLGLQSDLSNDVIELNSDITALKKEQHAIDYFYQIKTAEDFTYDSVALYRSISVSYVLFYPNSGRFEGFKSSGQLSNIRSERLRNSILDLYQESVPVLIGVTEHYNKQHDRLKIYLEERKEGEAIEDMLLTPRGKMILLQCKSLQPALFGFYNSTKRKTEEIIQQIDSMYPAKL